MTDERLKHLLYLARFCEGACGGGTDELIECLEEIVRLRAELDKRA